MNRFSIAFAYLVATVFSIFSQEEKKTSRFVVFTSPFGVFTNTIPLGVEYTLLPFFSLNIKGSYTYSESGKNELNYFKLYGTSVGGDIKLFIQYKYGHYKFSTMFKSFNKLNAEMSEYSLQRTGSVLVSKSYVKLDYKYEDLRNRSYFRGEPIDGFDFVHGAGLAFGVEWLFSNMIFINFYLGPYYYFHHTSDQYLNNLQKGSFFQSMMLKGSTGTKINLGFEVGFHF
ncbi:MAG: hypothetical protein N2Z72_06390 [Bacteroidales bacterium]|nr:hypothetical protein [Bacteroidales bacterium]